MSADAEVAQPITAGVAHMTFADYLGLPGVSQSMLNKINESPFALQQWEQREQTPAMKLGSATGCAILEPELFLQQYWRRTVNGSTKEGKAEKARHEDKVLLPPAEWAKCVGMKKAIWERGHAISLRVRRILLAARECDGIENSLFVADEENALWKKGRPDIWLPDQKILADIKTTKSARKHSFRRSIRTYGYHRQAAWYIALCNALGFEVDHYFLVCIESSTPHEIFIYHLGERSLKLGQQECERLYARYVKCLAENHWPPAQEKAEDIDLEEWAFMQEGADQ